MNSRAADGFGKTDGSDGLFSKTTPLRAHIGVFEEMPSDPSAHQGIFSPSEKNIEHRLHFLGVLRIFTVKAQFDRSAQSATIVGSPPLELDSLLLIQ